MAKFDPYHKWLGISPKDQPPHHYRLLGIDLFEEDQDVIEAAADRNMAFIQQCALGEHQKESQQILNELSAARVCLLVAEQKEKYDTDLRATLKPVPPSQTLKQKLKRKLHNISVRNLRVAGGVFLVILVIMIGFQFLGGEDEKNSQSQTAAITKPAVPSAPDSIQFKIPQVGQTNYKRNNPKPPKQTILHPNPERPYPRE